MVIMRLHAVLLLLLAALVFLPGLDRHGVTNWQEGQRLIVAREMLDRARAAGSTPERLHAIMLPTVHATPYLAKPPMIYWAQVGLAAALGERVELWHLRLVVALAGIAGVLITYFAAIVILRPDREWCGPGDVPLDERWVHSSAFWSAACLCTGVLYVRSGRIGELDILLVPFCTLAIGAIGVAWRHHRLHGRAHWPALALATFSTTLAVFSKDPGLMIVAFGSYGGIALAAAYDPRIRSGRPRLELAGAALGALAGGLATLPTVHGARDGAGLLLIASGCAWVGFILARLSDPARLRGLISAFSRTHPLIVLGVPLLVRWAWKHEVAALIGKGQTAMLITQEVEDNVRLFVAEAPLNNLEALPFAVALGSVAAIVGVVWIARTRPAIPPGWFQLIAWLGFTLLAFSVLGKGVQRYLTPLWPAIAMLGGLTIASLLVVHRRHRLLPHAIAGVVVLLGMTQSWWYAAGRERDAAERSPRDLVAELKARPDFDPDRLVSFEFSSPALAYYADQRVEPIGETGVNDSMSGGPSWSMDQLREEVRSRSPLFAFIRAARIRGEFTDPPLERLRLAGFVAEELPTTHRIVVDGGRSVVKCFRLTLANR